MPSTMRMARSPRSVKGAVCGSVGTATGSAGDGSERDCWARRDLERPSERVAAVDRLRNSLRFMRTSEAGGVMRGDSSRRGDARSRTNRYIKFGEWERIGRRSEDWAKAKGFSEGQRKLGGSFRRARVALRERAGDGQRACRMVGQERKL